MIRIERRPWQRPRRPLPPDTWPSRPRMHRTRPQTPLGSSNSSNYSTGRRVRSGRARRRRAAAVPTNARRSSHIRRRGVLRSSAWWRRCLQRSSGPPRKCSAICAPRCGPCPLSRCIHGSHTLEESASTSPRRSLRLTRRVICGHRPSSSPLVISLDAHPSAHPRTPAAGRGRPTVTRVATWLAHLQARGGGCRRAVNARAVSRPPNSQNGNPNSQNGNPAALGAAATACRRHDATPSSVDARRREESPGSGGGRGGGGGGAGDVH